MKNRVIEAIAKYDMLAPGDHVIVGLSGGADSCALVHVLFSLHEQLGIEVSACHINHNLRGDESDGDEKFVRRFCKELGIALEVYNVDVKKSLGKHESIEEAARRLRYECFGKACGTSGSKLATAHTANDSAETVLMNIIRGTGTKGLAGIPPVRENFIRPLIFCSREQTEEYCVQNGIDYVTDSTNLTDDCTRNRVRHRLLPLLKEFNPSVIEAMTRMSAAVGDDEAFIEEYSRRCAEECKKGIGYDSRRLGELPAAVKFRIISAELKRNGVEPTRLRISQCCEIIDRGMGKVNLQKNRFAYVRKKIFFAGEEIQNYRRDQFLQ